MLDTICTLPLQADLFTQALHPNLPVLAIGLSSGHVSTLSLPPVDSPPPEDGEPVRKKRRGSNGTSVIDTAWNTRRHKGSCRALNYSLDGSNLYSAGTDGIVKAADSETGRVVGKVAIPAPSTSRAGEIDAPTVLHALSPQTLLLATDSGALHLYDLRDPAPSVPISGDSVDLKKTAFTSVKPSQTHHPHLDYISSLTPLPPSSTSTSGYSKQWLTTGGTTLALTDLRRGVLVRSEDQEEILLSSVYVTDLGAKQSSTSTGEKALVGGGDGVITLWEKGQWDDQDSRITVSKQKETVDCLVPVPGTTGRGQKVAAGLGDGKVRFVSVRESKVVEEYMHDEVEGVVGLGFDIGGRMVSGGGQTVKVWQPRLAGEEADGENENGVAKMDGGGDEDSDDDEGDQDSSEEEEKASKRRKRRKRGKGPPRASGFSFSGLD